MSVIGFHLPTVLSSASTQADGARGADMLVVAPEEEVGIVRGMALAAIFELQISQAEGLGFRV